MEMSYCPFVDMGLTNGNSFRRTTTNNANETHVFGICLFQTRKRWEARELFSIIITIPPALHHHVRLVTNKRSNEDSTANL